MRLRSPALLALCSHEERLAKGPGRRRADKAHWPPRQDAAAEQPGAWLRAARRMAATWWDLIKVGSARTGRTLRAPPRGCGRLGARPTLAAPDAGGQHQRGLCRGHLPVAGLLRAAPPGVPRAGRLRRGHGAAGRDRRAAAAGADPVRLRPRARGCRLRLRPLHSHACLAWPVNEALVGARHPAGVSSPEGASEEMRCCAAGLPPCKACLHSPNIGSGRRRVGRRPGSDLCAAPGAGMCGIARPP
jgi:hypothetical protein